MTALDDFSRLARDDGTYVRVSQAKRELWERRGVTFVSTGTTAIAMQDYACPIDPTATARILYWTVSDRRDIAVRHRDLADCLMLAFVEADRIGSPKIWGLVPEYQDHLGAFLDRVVAADACEKTAGLDESSEGRDNFGGFVFYIADVTKARRFMESV